MTMSALTRLVLVLLFFVTPLSSSSTQNQSNFESNWEEIRQYYDSSHFEKALELLQTHPQENSAYYYDLGTLYYKLGRLGPALGYMTKAYRLKPHNSDIHHNLSVIRSSVSRKIGLENLDPSSSFLEQLSDPLSFNDVRVGVGASGILMCLLFIQSFYATRKTRRTLLNLFGMIGLSGFIVALSVYGIYRVTQLSPPAIALERQVARSGPGDHFSALGQIQEGTQVRLLDSSGEIHPSPLTQGSEEVWKQIRFSPDGIGWVRASSLPNI